MAANEPISKTVACIFDIEEALFEYDDGNLGNPELPGIASMIKVMFDVIIDLLLYALEPLKFILNGDIPGLTNWLIPYSTGFIGAMYDLFMNKIWKKFELGLKVNLPPFSIDLGIISIPLPGINTGNPNPPGWVYQIPNYILFLLGILLFPFKIIYEIITGLLQFEFPAINFEFFKKIWEAILPGLGLPVTAKFPLIKFGNCMLNQLLGIVPEGIPDTSVTPDSPIPLDWKNMYNSYPTPDGDDTPLAHKDKINFKLNSNPSGEIYIEGTYTGTDVEIKSQKKKGVIIEGPDKLFFSVEHIAPAPGGFPVTINSLPLFQKAVLKLKCTASPTDPPRKASLILRDTDDNITKFSLITRGNTIYDLLQDGYKSKGGEWDPEVNLFGIRYENKRTNIWEDILGVAYFESGVWKCKWARGTTRPGSPRNMTVAQAAAAGIPDRHDAAKGFADYYYHDNFNKDLFTKGKHGGKGNFYNSPALVCDGYSDPGGLAKSDGASWRDPANSEKDGIFDTKKPFGKYYDTCNFHTTAVYPDDDQPPSDGPATKTIGDYSFGCQVVQYVKNYTRMMDILLSYFSTGKRYGYMLFLRDSVPELWEKLDADLPPIGSEGSEAKAPTPDIQIN
jgi:hypothetical protein